jgi:hypothetical protein
MERFGYSIFCDDIRNEVGGKLSFVGCYNAIMFVSGKFPLTLPKFCIHVHILTTSDRPFRSILARCYVPELDQPVIEDEIHTPDPGDQVALVANLETPRREPRYIAASASLILAPLRIHGPGLIRARALVDGGPEEMKLGSLRIEFAS